MDNKPRYGAVNDPQAKQLLQAIKLLIHAYADLQESLLDCLDQLNINRSFFNTGTDYLAEILGIVNEALGEN